MFGLFGGGKKEKKPKSLLGTYAQHRQKKSTKKKHKKTNHSYHGGDYDENRPTGDSDSIGLDEIIRYNSMDDR